MGFIPQPHLKVNPDDPWGRTLPFVAALGTLPHLCSSPLPSKSLPRSRRFQAASSFQNTRNSPQNAGGVPPGHRDPHACPPCPAAARPNLALSTPCYVPHILPPVPTYFRKKKIKPNPSPRGRLFWGRGKQLLASHPRKLRGPLQVFAVWANPLGFKISSQERGKGGAEQWLSCRGVRGHPSPRGLGEALYNFGVLAEVDNLRSCFFSYLF